MSAEERATPREGAVREQLREQPGPRTSSAPGGDGDRATGRPDAERSGAEDERDGEVVDAPSGAELEGAQPDDEEAAEAASDPLAETERQRDEFLALAQRTQADFDNFRRRAARETGAATARGKAGVVRELLPALDNLERALAAAGEADEGLAGGVRMVHSELVGALERSGVVAFEPSGEPFDPNFHEALSTRPADGAEPGVVLEVVEKGYRLDDTVLRPARVIVSA